MENGLFCICLGLGCIAGLIIRMTFDLSDIAISLKRLADNLSPKSFGQ